MNTVEEVKSNEGNVLNEWMYDLTKIKNFFRLSREVVYRSLGRPSHVNSPLDEAPK